MGLKVSESDHIDTTEALKIINEIAAAPVSLPTLISWAQNYKIGKKVGGRWWIDKQKLIDMLREGNSDGK